MKWSNKLIASSSVVTYLKLSFISYVLVASSFVMADQPNITLYEYLARVIDANNTQNFSGIFIYAYPDYKIQSSVISKSIKTGNLDAGLKKLIAREGFLRGSSGIKCITKAYNKLRINTFLQSIQPPQINNILNVYDVRLADGEITVANRAAYELIFQAIEGERYTYKLAFDKQTFVPLQFVFLDQQQTILERGYFSEFSPTAKELTQSEFTLALLNVSYPQATEQDSKWLVGWMPKGFNLKQRINQANIQNNQLVYTDGLVSFSVFIEPLINKTMLNIAKQFGATTVVSRKVVASSENNQPYQVTVVGEIPSSTALHIASSVYQK